MCLLIQKYYCRNIGKNSLRMAAFYFQNLCSSIFEIKEPVFSKSGDFCTQKKTKIPVVNGSVVERCIRWSPEQTEFIFEVFLGLSNNRECIFGDIFRHSQMFQKNFKCRYVQSEWSPKNKLGEMNPKTEWFLEVHGLQK